MTDVKRLDGKTVLITGKAAFSANETARAAETTCSSVSVSRGEFWRRQRDRGCLGNEGRACHRGLQRPGEGPQGRGGDQAAEPQSERQPHGAGPGQPQLHQGVLQGLPPEGEEAGHPDQQRR